MTVAETRFVQAHLNGLFAADFTASGKVVIDVADYNATAGMIPPKSVRIHDARQIQAAADDAESAFFERHGFVLLRHESAVRDWGAPGAEPGNGSTATTTADIADNYAPEVEALIRDRLLPGRNIEIQQPPYLLRRGAGTPNPFYGLAVHNDYGLTADDYEDNTAAFATEEAAKQWRDRYERGDVQGYLTINFWRTVFMTEPLRHVPLAVCDARSIPADDLIASGLKNFTPTGRISTQQNLRYNPGHRWHYYPRMTGDEVLAFKNFQCMKTDPEPVLRSCFHTAFDEPGAPPDAEPRQSCEHRVGVFFLRE